MGAGVGKIVAIGPVVGEIAVVLAAGLAFFPQPTIPGTSANINERVSSNTIIFLITSRHSIYLILRIICYVILLVNLVLFAMKQDPS